jgi:hypothetical protein
MKKENYYLSEEKDLVSYLITKNKSIVNKHILIFYF